MQIYTDPELGDCCSGCGSETLVKNAILCGRRKKLKENVFKDEENNGNPNPHFFIAITKAAASG
jgi:hypothetical protein